MPTETPEQTWWPPFIFQGRVDLEARRNRGRPATSYMDNMDNITSSIGLRIDEVIHSSTDRDDWRAVVDEWGSYRRSRRCWQVTGEVKSTKYHFWNWRPRLFWNTSISMSCIKWIPFFTSWRGSSLILWNNIPIYFVITTPFPSFWYSRYFRYTQQLRKLGASTENLCVSLSAEFTFIGIGKNSTCANSEISTVSKTKLANSENCQLPKNTCSTVFL